MNKFIILVSFIFTFSNKIFPQAADSMIYEARYIFHRAYFEEADRKFKELAIKHPTNALVFAYLNMIDYMLFRSHKEKAEIHLTGDNPDFFFITALLTFTKNDFKGAADSLEKHIKRFPEDVFARHALGFCRTDNGEPGEGLKVLLKLIKDDSSYFPAYNHIGYAYMALNDYENALTYLKMFVERDSLNPSAYDSYAEGLAGQQRYDDAVLQLTKSVILEKEFAYGWRHMGELFLKMD